MPITAPACIVVGVLVVLAPWHTHISVEIYICIQKDQWAFVEANQKNKDEIE
jgi:hypothetical protein